MVSVFQVTARQNVNVGLKNYIKCDFDKVLDWEFT